MQRILSDRYQHLADLSDRFCGATSRSLERRHLLLAGLGTAIKAKNPAQILSREIPERKENLSTLAGRLIQSAGSSLMKRRMEIEITAARLASCGPEAIWNRGFCLVMKEGRPVPGAGTLEVDDQVLLRFRDGIADAVIRMVNTHEKV
jgi:exonuclease VII large subunit